ncbi:hypothetical protein F5883DRAFT_588042, partial [Diaporthe sp. PMI_573]
YWLPRPPLPDADRNSWEYYNQAIDNARTSFAEILAKTPGIKSFVCMPMPSGHPVVAVSPDSDAYPFSAGILRAYSRRDADADAYGAYEGLFGILLPYIVLSESRIRRLLCVDDNQQSVLRQLGRFNDASQRLRSISFIIQACLVPKEEDDEGSHYERQNYYENLANLGKFLRGAHDLEELTIEWLGDEGGYRDRSWLSNQREEEFVIEPGQSDEILEDDQTLLHDKDLEKDEMYTQSYRDGNINSLLFGGQDGLTTWPHLHFLLLNNLPIKQNDLINLIRCHAVSLRGVILENYDISFKLLEAMHDMHALRLESLQISCDHDAEKGGRTTEELLLRYINNAANKWAMPGDVRWSNTITTHDIKWPFQHDIERGRHALELEDANDGENISEYYTSSSDDADSVDSHSQRLKTAPWWKWARFSLSPTAPVYYWRCRQGNAAGRRTTIWRFRHRSGVTAWGREPLAHFEDWDSYKGDAAYPEPSCRAFWDFQDTFAECLCCRYGYKKCIVAQIGWAVELVEEQWPKGIEHCDGIISDHPDEEDKEEQGLEVGEDSSQRDDNTDLLPPDLQSSAPRWKWALFPDGEVYYWRVASSDSGASPTQIWRFQYRSGAVRYGSQPRDHFSDWDTTAGDVAEPTPHCRELRLCAGYEYEDDNCEECGCSERVLGAALEILAMGNYVPPHGAVKYTDDEGLGAIGSGWERR